MHAEIIAIGDEILSINMLLERYRSTVHELEFEPEAESEEAVA